MKITNIEKFRKELFDNLKAVCPANVSEVSETFFERKAENGNLCEVTHLFDCAEISRYGSDRPFYIELDAGGQASIWTINKGEKFFTLVTSVYDWNYTKTQYMMRVATELSVYMYSYKN